MNRVLALDVGDRRIGIAVSDAMGWTAQGIETYTRQSEEGNEDAIDRVLLLANQYGVTRILLGLPRNMNGSIGPQAEKVIAFSEELKNRWQGEIDFMDERLTTVSAQRMLVEADMSRKKRKQVVDKIAAVLILQGYLDSGAHGREPAGLPKEV